MTAVSCSSKCINITITVGIILSVVGIILIFSYPKIITSKIVDQLPLVNGSESFKRWQEMDKIPIKFSVFVFNVTNVDDVMKNETEKIQVEQVGPYVFREVKHKDIIEMDETEIEYVPRNVFFFDRNNTHENLSLSDKFTVINTPLITAMNIPKGMKRRREPALKVEFAKTVIKGAISVVKPTLFETHPVSDLLFDGYVPPLFTQLKKMMPKDPIPGRFGLLMDKNDTQEEGKWTISTGKSGIESFAQIKLWNGNETLHFWDTYEDNKTDTEPCNEVKGTDGAQFSPSVTEKSVLWAFVTDLCRTIPFKFIGKGEVMDVETLKFAIPKEFYDAPSKFPQNNCFCTKQGDDRIQCDNDGVMDVSVCRKDAPILMSAPHFWNAANYTKGIDGLKPDINLHQTVIEVEPWTGAVVKAARRLMVSLEAKHDPLYTQVTNVNALNRTVAVPLVWIEESAQLDDEKKNELDQMLFRNVRLLKGISVTVVVMGLLTSIIGIIMHFVIVRRMGSLTFV